MTSLLLSLRFNTAFMKFFTKKFKTPSLKNREEEKYLSPNPFNKTTAIKHDPET